MAQRKLLKARCKDCGIHSELCMCAYMPKIATQNPFVLIQGFKESQRPSSTGTLAHKIFTNSQRCFYGEAYKPFDYSIFENIQNPALIYPHHSAIPFEFLEKAPQDVPRTIFFVDGTWPEVRRIINRLKLTTRMPSYSLLSGAPTEWGVRKETHDGGLATIEAICRVMSRLEKSPQIEADVMDFFRKNIARVFYMRGMRKSPYLEGESLVDQLDQSRTSVSS